MTGRPGPARPMTVVPVAKRSTLRRWTDDDTNPSLVGRLALHSSAFPAQRRRRRDMRPSFATGFRVFALATLTYSKGYLADIHVFPEADPMVDRLHLLLWRLV